MFICDHSTRLKFINVTLCEDGVRSMTPIDTIDRDKWSAIRPVLEAQLNDKIHQNIDELRSELTAEGFDGSLVQSACVSVYDDFLVMNVQMQDVENPDSHPGLRKLLDYPVNEAVLEQLFGFRQTWKIRFKSFSVDGTDYTDVAVSWISQTV